MMMSRLRYGGKFLFVFALAMAWVFSGWPTVIQEARATAPVPAYRASGTFTAGTGSITPPYPAGMAANDICLLVVTSENQAISLTTANGFVEIPTWSPQSAGTAATDPASRLAVYWKRTVGGDSAPVVADSGDNNEGVIHCFSGVTTNGNPWDIGAGGNDSAANDTTGTIPGATTTADNDLVVLITSTSVNGTGTANFSTWTNANLTSITERQDNSNTAGLGGGSGMATGVKATAGAYTTTTVTLAATSFKGALSLALKPPQLPTVTTQAASSVAATTATGNGNITDTGGATASAWGVCYKTSSGCTTADSTAAGSGGGGTGAFTASMTSLSSNTTYYIKAYATNSAGTSYGSEVTILTLPGAPTSLNASNITLTALRVNWTAPTGGAASYKVERCQGSGCSNFSQIASGVATAYHDDSGLTAGTTYRYQVRATNSAGDGAYSSALETSTSSATVSVTITTDGAIAYGTIIAGGTKTTITLADTQTAKNDGDVAEDFNIKGQNTACPWTLTATSATDQYVHEFSTNGGTNYTALTTSYQALATNIAVNGTQNVDLRITTPTSTNCFTQQSADIIIQAVQH